MQSLLFRVGNLFHAINASVVARPLVWSRALGEIKLLSLQTGLIAQQLREENKGSLLKTAFNTENKGFLLWSVQFGPWFRRTQKWELLLSSVIVFHTGCVDFNLNIAQMHL